jgi:hypothetical protein
MSMMALRSLSARSNSWVSDVGRQGPGHVRSIRQAAQPDLGDRYAANRRAAIESIIEADPIANCVRAIMADRPMWTGSASDLLQLCAESARNDISVGGAWARNPRALAGRLRRAQTSLRTLGIEITFSREGRSGTRIIRVSTDVETTVSTVSIVGAARSNGSHCEQAGLTFAPK